jgi:hypothetical protein
MVARKPTRIGIECHFHSSDLDLIKHLGVENIEGDRRERWTSGGCCFHDGAKSCSAERFGGVDDTGDGILIKARTVPAKR